MDRKSARWTPNLWSGPPRWPPQCGRRCSEIYFARRRQKFCAATRCENNAKPKWTHTEKPSPASWSRDRGCEGTLVLPPSSGARPFHPRGTSWSDARKAVHGLPWSLNGLQERRICAARGWQVVQSSECLR